MDSIGPFETLTDEDRATCLATFMETAPTGAFPDNLWVYAYGSLMWRPEVPVTETRAATLEGHVRGFNIWTVRARGTPEKPGLGCGLQIGNGLCHGKVHRLSPDKLDESLDAVWFRERFTDIYRPGWVEVSTPAGPVTAFTFIVDPDHPQYAGDLDKDTAAKLIAEAAGIYGTCREYLESLVAELDRHGIADPDLSELLTRVVEVGSGNEEREIP